MNSVVATGYDPRSYPPIAVTVDVVLFAIHCDALHVLLIERGDQPFLGCWALPGGFVQPKDRSLDRAAERELEEETDVRRGEVHIEQLGSYGARDRDPRMRVVTVAYWAACSRPPRLMRGGDASWAGFVPASMIESGGLELAFDHQAIVADALARLRAKLEYTAVAVRFCEPEFTITELRRVYEIIWNTTLDAGNFQRKFRQNGSFRPVGRAAYARRAAAVARAPARAPSRLAVPGASADAAFAQRESTEPKPRVGRPASLWSAADPSALLSSPIVRPDA